MKLIMENWRRYVKEDLLSELLVRGEYNPDERSSIIAFNKYIWLFPGDEVPEEYIEEIFPLLDLQVDDMQDPDNIDIGDIIAELDNKNRSDVIVGTIADGDMYIQSSGFRFDPNSSVYVKKIVKQLGLSHVTTQDVSGYGDEETRHSKWGMTGKISDVAYHGTSSQYLENILRLGLKPGESKTNYKMITHSDKIFFSSRLDEALMHAQHTTREIGGEPVVIEMKIPDKAKVVPDYDIDVATEDGYYHDISADTRGSQRERGTMPGSSTTLSREFGIYGYEGRVPVSHITGVYVILGEAEEGASTNDLTHLDMEEAKMFLYTLENFGYGDPYYDEEEHEDEEININIGDE